MDTDELTYGSYLRVPELLALQQPRSRPPHPEELHFIVVHQALELWMKLLLHDLGRIVELLDGDSVDLQPILVVDGSTVLSSVDDLAKVSITGNVLWETKGPKIKILKFKNKTGYRKRQGHRQKYTQVKVTDISA